MLIFEGVNISYSKSSEYEIEYESSIVLFSIHFCTIVPSEMIFI